MKAGMDILENMKDLTIHGTVGSKILGNMKDLSIQTPGIGDLLKKFNISNNAFLWVFAVVFVIVCLVGLGIVLDKRSVMSTPENVRRISGTQIKTYDTALSPYYKPKQSMTSLSPDPMERCLVNYAPFTVFNPGYIGPTVNGVYSERDGVASAIKAGARCFVLPIDYHDDASLKPPLFAFKGQPCLLMRDTAGVIRSLNSGSIQRVAQALSDVAFSDISPNKNDPLILILYFVRAPPANTKEYLRYMSSVAKQLSPLIQYHIGQTPEGVYNRQGRQNELLYTNITNFERKLLVFCNADLTLFRNTKSIGLPAFSPREDLDFWVHLRLFKQSEEDFGITQMADQNTFMRGMVEKVSYYTFIPDKQKVTTVDSNKIRWVVALNTAGSNPTTENMKRMMDVLGVQCIPLLLSDLNEKEKETIDLWKTSGWRFKPVPVRFRKPEPVKPLAPSPKLNANQGKITSPKL